ncbi:hypothetical protein [Deinococcus roseus]|uniref:Uncharacterized protein n=1 Tax=Deinococcus roseus TaxID=392414 RepID=A0ABQ2D5Y5_9DEIO|nr:hypothetical protein [Deinococcus roseus]GGJ47297.1 hypothetical protein GCM10008938_36660 [Deinococcus roseus]
MLPHYSNLSELPLHLSTRRGLQALNLWVCDLQPVATVQAFGKVLPLYLVEEAQPLLIRHSEPSQNEPPAQSKRMMVLD